MTAAKLTPFLLIFMLLGLLAGGHALAADAKKASDNKNKAHTVKTVKKAQPAVAAKPAAKPAPAKPAPAADTADAGSGLPVPRFVTLGAEEVNMRTGPALKYPIRLVIRRSGLPVEIVREFDVWREIRDMDGDEGWVHKSMLSGKRGVIVKGTLQPLLKKPDEAAPPVVKLEPGVIASLKTCKGQWCDLRIQTYSGWIRRGNVWGVYPEEKFQE